MLLEAALASLPWLAGAREVTELPGGLTNHNYRVRTAEHDVVVRLSTADSELLGVDREHEWRNSRTAADVGVGAPVLDYLPGQGVLVVSFLPGRTYAAADVGANLPRIAASLRRLHAAPEFASAFDMFEIQRCYAEIVGERRMAVPDGYGELADRACAVEAALRARPERLVPCHNDLLAANFLDDGGDVRIIDYEYSGMNEPAFELGNLVNESQLDHDHLVELVEAYYGTVTAQRLARAELWGLAGRYAWTLWGAIQHTVSDVGADFWSFALERFEPAAQLLTSRRLDVLIADAVADGGRR
ncbi:thiamine kinase-like enzyme [Humibacillus xanthopallidus]|uniref:Thiamine kinase-like enzyme n=1 Tax=Humibacillus xanthopallidus TaxID=412689 RepID=A0A543PSM8_9MICO|nr:choline/ethanolamine kinase family protein [Humibacillus xanthopallidus]TQN47087.1 thiamine kinase-like enzyme [Humibacillus xanthopallidus]